MTAQREILAGGPDAFMTVRNLTLAGTQAEIGRVLAEEAAERYNWRPVPADPAVSRARRTWFERHWPQHHARMKGAAAAAGLDPDDDSVYLDALSGLPDGSGCSATWYAPSATQEARGLLARNYDFFTVGMNNLFALLAGTDPGEYEPSMASRPYVVTTRPDGDTATTIITMNELDGCTEGINEHGLAVVMLLADAESAGAPVEAGPQVGVSSLQLPLYVLDTCTNVDEAKQALLGAKQYDLGIPLHYLFADRSGRAFVWERGAGGVEHIVEADGESLCATNHFLHLPVTPEKLAQDDAATTMLTYQRHRHLTDRAKAGPTSAAGIRKALDEIRFDAHRAGGLPIRTLWRTVFDLDDCTMSAHFYLGDDPDDPGTPGSGLVYSKEATFSPRAH